MGPLRCSLSLGQKIGPLRWIVAPLFTFKINKKNASRACGNCGKAEGFSKLLWESVLFTDFHRSGSFHRLFFIFCLNFVLD